MDNIIVIANSNDCGGLSDDRETSQSQVSTDRSCAEFGLSFTEAFSVLGLRMMVIVRSCIAWTS